MSAGKHLLAIDTSTSVAAVAIGDANGKLEMEEGWPAGYRHGEDLLPRVRDLLTGHGIGLDDLIGVVVGTGPGAFTGLRVGIATAKGIAHALALPIAGVPSGEALLAAAGVPRAVLLLPAGPNDRVIVRAGRSPERLAGGAEPDLASEDVVIAIDLDGRAGADAAARGEAARAGFAGALLRLGAERLENGGDDLAQLVPEYVTLPRGVAAATGEVAWSRDHR